MKKPALVSTIAIAVILAGTTYEAFGLRKTPPVEFISVKSADITQQVSDDGSVTAAQDLSLAFEQGGTVSEVDVKAGDHVKKGQTLIKLNSSDSATAVSQASAALAAAQANYQKLLAGATNASVQVSQAAVDTASTTLANTKKNLDSVTSQQA